MDKDKIEKTKTETARMTEDDFNKAGERLIDAYEKAGGEPEPEINTLIVKGTEHPEERIPLYKPDESRLLTDKEIFEIGQTTPIERLYWYQVGWKIAKAQLALDQLHEQARVERIFKEIDSLLGTYCYGDGSFIAFQNGLQALKKKNGIIPKNAGFDHNIEEEGL